MVQKIVPTHQHAGDVGADLYVVLARWLGPQHGVVRKHAADVQFQKVKPLRDLRYHRVRDIADLILRVEQHRHQGRAAHRIDRDQMVKARRSLRRKDRVGNNTHAAMISRASLSAAKSISSSSPSTTAVPFSVREKGTILPSLLSYAAEVKLIHFKPCRTVMRSSETSTTACCVLLNPWAAA